MKVLISKQCDFDIDLIPCWYYWYTKINPVDKIIVLLVKTPNSQIEKTIKFYQDKDVQIAELHADYFDDTEIWDFQLELLNKLDLKEPYQICYPDTDEFIENINDVEEDFKGILPLTQIRLISDVSVTKENIKEANIYLMPETSRLIATEGQPKGILFNVLDSKNMKVAGHINIQIDDYSYFYYHLHIRGFEWFKNKFSNYDFETLEGQTAWHAKLYQRYLKEGKAEEVFKETIKDAQKQTTEESKEFTNRFKNYFI